MYKKIKTPNIKYSGQTWVCSEDGLLIDNASDCIAKPATFLFKKNEKAKYNLPCSDIHVQLKSSENYVREEFKKVKDDSTNFVTADIGFMCSIGGKVHFIHFPIRHKDFNITDIFTTPSEEIIEKYLISYNSNLFKDDTELMKDVKYNHTVGNRCRHLDSEEKLKKEKIDKIEKKLKENTEKMIRLSKRTYDPEFHFQHKYLLEKEKEKELDDVQKFDINKVCMKEIEQVDRVSKSTRFKHSERLLFKFLIDNSNYIIKTAQKIIDFKFRKNKEDVEILQVLLFLHSSRYVCKDCENVIISNQDKLNSLLQRKFKEECEQIENYKFSSEFDGLQTMITADIPFPRKGSIKTVDDYDKVEKGYSFIINDKKNMLFCADTESQTMHISLQNTGDDLYRRSVFMSGTLSSKIRSSTGGKQEDIENIHNEIFKNSRQKIEKAVITIQSGWRGYVERKHYKELREKNNGRKNKM